MSTAETPEPEAGDALERLTQELLEDSELFAEPETDEAEGGGLTWIRTTLRTGGDESDPLVGSLFHDKYRVLRKVGVGGFGAVYEALDERGAQNRVALKIMLPSVVQGDQPLEMFRGEAVRVTRLHHPNIVDWKSFDRTPNGSYYFVMELVEGEDLQTVLGREGPLEWRRSLRILLQILGALRAAHFVGEGQSILHLDLKPKNILLLPERRSRPESAKVIDFGIGQYLGGEELEPSSEVSGEVAPPVPARGPRDFTTVTTRTDPARNFERRAAAYPFKISQACTPQYASPEQCGHILFADGADLEPRQLDGRSDLYSFGVIAYEMLTGRLPFARPAHRFQFLELHREAPIDPWGAGEKAVPRALRRFVERCLEKDPDNRWADAHEAHEALERVARPSRVRWFVAAALALVLLGVGIARALASPPVAYVALERDRGHVSERSRVFSARLRDSAANSSIELGGDSLLFDAEGSPLEGWTLEPSRTRDEFEIEIAPTAAWVARNPGRVVLDGLSLGDASGTWKSSTSLRLIWLGPRTWQHRFLLDGHEVSTSDGRDPHPARPVVDPRGVRFVVEFAELESGDLDLDASVVLVEGRPFKLREQSREGGGVRLECSLEDLSSGELDVQFLLGNEAGEELTLALPLTVRTGGPTFTLHARDSAGRIRPWSATQPLVLEDEDSAALVVTCVEYATLACAELGVDRQPLLPGSATEIVELRSFLERMVPGESRALELLLSDDVRCSKDRADEHQKRVRLELQVIDGMEVQVSLIPPRKRDSRSSGVFTGRSEPVTFGPDDRLLLNLGTQIPLGSLVLELQVRDREGVRVLGTQGVTRAPSMHDFHIQGDLGAFARPLEDGEYVLHVDSLYRSSAMIPIDSCDLPFRIDTLEPVVRIRDSLEGPPRITQQDSHLELLFEEDTRGSRVDLTFQVLRAGEPIGEPRRASNASYGDDGASATWSVEPHESLSRDGAYQLALWAEDQGGNRQDLPPIDFEVALRGPELRLRSPKPGIGEGAADWKRAGQELVPIVIEASDPNGLGLVQCFVLRSERAPEASAPLSEDLRAAAQQLDRDGDEIDSWRWTFTPDEGWSEAGDMYLHFEATDARGALSHRTEGPFALPVVRRRLRPQLGNMLLIDVDETAEYTFRGRTPDEENACFARAQLADIWVEWGSAKPGQNEAPWAVSVPPGSLRPFYLDRDKVAVGEFIAFLEDPAGYSEPSNWSLWARPDEERRTALLAALRGCDPRAPVTGVRFAEALAYAARGGQRLPTLLELEYATRDGLRYRAWSWDALGDVVLDDPGPRVRGLSRAAEWTASPAAWRAGADAPPGPCIGPGASIELFLPLANAELLHAEELWIRGSLGGTAQPEGAALRRDFAAVDAVPARSWTNARVGFRCARDAREAREAQGSLTRGTREESPR